MSLQTQTFDIHTSGVNALTFTSADQSLIIAAGVTIANDDPIFFSGGVYDGQFASGSLINHGSISGGFGVTFAGDSAVIVNSTYGYISGAYGIELLGPSGRATNFGSIWATNTGVALGGQSGVLDNRALVYSIGSAVSDGEGSTILNSGTLEGAGVGIAISSATAITHVLNTGTIRGGVAAILQDSGAGALELQNFGTLVGGITMLGLFNQASNADNIVNSGSISGAIHLGGGNDTFSGFSGISGAIFGEAGSDTLTGGRSGDKISGGAGSDSLAGGPGADHFVFDAAIDAGANIDQIKDFAVPSDTIDLKHAIFGAIGGLGKLAAPAFFMGAAAHDLSDRLIYNPANGFITYDSNGSHAGGATHFATVAAHLHPTNADFLVVV